MLVVLDLIVYMVVEVVEVDMEVVLQMVLEVMEVLVLVLDMEEVVLVGMVPIIVVILLSTLEEEEEEETVDKILVVGVEVLDELPPVMLLVDQVVQALLSLYIITKI
jgi:hypothetical protein